MIIQTKFDPGETVYGLYSLDKWITETCNICSGSGIISSNRESFTCPKCLNEGEVGVSSYKEWFATKSNMRISHIRLSRYENQSTYFFDHTLYYVYDSPDCLMKTHFPEGDLFSSYEEAMQEAVERNKKTNPSNTN